MSTVRLPSRWCSHWYAVEIPDQSQQTRFAIFSYDCVGFLIAKSGAFLFGRVEHAGINRPINRLVTYANRIISQLKSSGNLFGLQITLRKSLLTRLNKSGLASFLLGQDFFGDAGNVPEPYLASSRLCCEQVRGQWWIYFCRGSRRFGKDSNLAPSRTLAFRAPLC